MRKGWFAGVGSSSSAPEDALKYMVRLGRTMTDLGYGLSSGDAPRSDQAFYQGALLSPRFKEVGMRIYLAWNGIGSKYHDPEAGWHDATRYQDTYEQAKQMAEEARGSFAGLGPGGIMLMTRNVFQIHGHTLTDPVRIGWYWGIPVGKTEKVKGGTNCALQLMIKAGIVRYNLYTEEGLGAALRFLSKYESTEPYPDEVLSRIEMEPRRKNKA